MEGDALPTRIYNDTIKDFGVNSANVIQFSHVVFNDLGDVKSHATQDGFDVVVDAGGSDTLRLKDVSLDQLQQDDFVFV